MSSAPRHRILTNDLRAQWEQIRTTALEAMDRVGQSGWFIPGSEVASFEKELAKFWGLPFCVGCGNGLDALEISLRCLGLERGDRVLTTPLSAFATTMAIVRAGGVPVFVDVDRSGSMDLGLAAQLLETDHTIRFLLPVHLFGHAMRLDRLAELKSRFDLLVVEDCAQAIGARSGGQPVGSVGELAATSFYPTKNLGCMGDGGAILTADGALAELAGSLRNYGEVEKYDHEHMGMNSRLDELHAAILRDALLPGLGRVTERRIEIAARYRAEIRSSGLSIPPVPEGSESVWHLFPVIVPGGRAPFLAHLNQLGIEAGVHYPKLIPEQGALKCTPGHSRSVSLVRATEFADCEVSLPIHPFLSDHDVERVIEACNGWEH